MTAAIALVSYEEYLRFEEASDLRHELIRGEIVPMARGTIEHSILVASVSSELVAAVEDRPCVVLDLGGRIWIEKADRATYPDVSVVWGKIDTATQDRNAITNPKVIVEVLSDLTEANDRGEKFSDYKRLDSLAEYVLVSQKKRLIERFRREGRGWAVEEFEPGERVDLESLGVSISVDDIYANPLERDISATGLESPTNLAEDLRQVLNDFPQPELVVLFGSGARGTLRPESDIDVGIRASMSRQDRLRLENQFEDVSGRTLDVVDLDRASPFLRLEIARDGVVLAERRPYAWADFRAKAMRDWFDFAEHSRVMEDTILNRLLEKVRGTR